MKEEHVHIWSEGYVFNDGKNGPVKKQVCLGEGTKQSASNCGFIKVDGKIVKN